MSSLGSKHELSRTLKITVLCYNNLLNKFFSGLNLTASQGEILLYLYSQSPNVVETKELLQFLGVSSASLSGTLKKLKQDGYITYSRGKSDTRKKVISLTAKATKYQELLEEKMQQFYEVTYRQIDELDCKAAYATLEKLIQNITSYLK